MRITLTGVLALIAMLICASSRADTPGVCLVRSARAQIGVTVLYDPSYRRITFPRGDVPIERGVCTDVLIRAYRQFGVDLQERVHDDMKQAWSSYPRLWSLTRPDPNIDHRRVPNLTTFFTRHGMKLSVDSRDPRAYRPGDLVTWRLPSGVPHIGIISDTITADGTPLVIHNIGSGVVEDDILFRYTITGHYRYTPPEVPPSCAAADSASD